MSDVQRANDFAAAFNRAAYDCRGWKGKHPSVETCADVSRMVVHFSESYANGFRTGIKPEVLARTLTDQWWDFRGSQPC